MLLALDEKEEKGKKGALALAVGMNALVNWNFFIGEVIFLILYYICKYVNRKTGRSLTQTATDVGTCFLEGLLGVGIAAVLVFPSLVSMLGNTRVTQHIMGENAISYNSSDALLLIKGILMPGEAMSDLSAVIPADWHSTSLYLPMLGVALVLVFLTMKREKDEFPWLNKILWICLIIALIPMLNSIFNALNKEPFRRWFYMPILMMALASGIVLERGKDRADYRTQITKYSLLLSFAVICLYAFLRLYPWKADGSHAVFRPSAFLAITLLALTGYILTIFFFRCHGERYARSFLVSISLFSAVCTCLSAYLYRVNAEIPPSCVYDEMFETTSNLKNDIIPYRYSLWDKYHNRGLSNSLTTTATFISTVDNSIFSLYDALGEHRHTVPRNGPIGTDELLSVRYVISEEPLEGQTNSREFSNGSHEVYVYEKQHFLPIGYTYDFYMTQTEFSSVEQPLKAAQMLRTLVVRDEDEKLVNKTLSHLIPSAEDTTSIDKIGKYVDEHLAEASSEFTHDTHGFTSKIHCDRDKYAFFSVPWSSRWSAEVNGKKVDILNINGLMAVPVKEGENVIDFSFDRTIVVVSAIFSVLSLCAAFVVFSKGKPYSI